MKPDGMDHATALDLAARIRREHPTWRGVGLWLLGPFDDFTVQAWTPLLPASFRTVAEYEAMETAHD